MLPFWLGACADDDRSDSENVNAGEIATGRDLACENPAESVAYEEVGVDWGLHDTTSESPNRKEHSPVAFADLDGDGDDDVLLADRESGLWMHQNNGDGFTVSLVAPLLDLTTIALADYDGDGDLDLFTGGKDFAVYAYQNTGGALLSVGAEIGLGNLGLLRDVRDLAFGDFDGDGDPDLYVTLANDGRTDQPLALDHLFRNEGGIFSDASELIPATARAGLGWQSTWFDADRDGDLDLFVANAEQSRVGPSRMLRNEGGAFTDVTDACGCGETGSNMGTSAADFNNDGWMDLFVTNTGPARLLQNDQTGAFIDVSLATEAGAVPDSNWMSFGSSAFDFDNDGDLDILAATGPLWDQAGGTQEPDQPDVFLKRTGETFTDIAAELGLDDAGAGRGVAFGNLDGDGFPDILVGNIGSASKLYRANCTGNGALVVELSDVLGNAFGDGARVDVETETDTQTRTINTKPGWAAANSPRAWFGLGNESPIRVTITWPDGSEQEVSTGTKRWIRVERE